MTRWLPLPIAAGLCACTSLNAAYDVGQDAGTDGAPTASTTDRPSGPGGSPAGSGGGTDAGATSDDSDTTAGAEGNTSAPDSGDTADPGGDETTDPGITSDGGSTTRGGESSGGAGESTGGESTGTAGSTGDATQVIFVYATTASFAFLDDDPFVTCELAEPLQASVRCEGDGRVPLVGTGDTALDEVLGDIDPHEVFGVLSDGATPLAPDPLAMIDGLDVSVAEGGVNIGPKEIFWTGAGANCMDWSDDIKSDGTVGTSSSTGASWYASEDVPCTQDLQILCACLSVPNPFD